MKPISTTDSDHPKSDCPANSMDSFPHSRQVLLRMRPSPSPFLPFAFCLLPFIFSVLLPFGCGGACQELSDGFQAELRREAALAGTGISAFGGGEYHIGMTLSPELLHTIGLEVNRVLEPYGDRLYVIDPETGWRETVILEMRPALEAMKMGDITENVVLLSFGVALDLSTRSVGRASRHYLTGWFTITGRLDLEYSDDLRSANLLLTFERFDRDTIDLGSHALSAPVAEAVNEWLHPAVSDLLFDQIGRVSLVSFPSLRSGGITVGFAPAGLFLSPTTGSAFLGFVTNLRPEPGGTVTPEFDAPSGSLRVSIHPGLPAAAARLALAEGIVPRAYTREAELDDDGPVQISLESLELSSDHFDMGYRLWDLGSGYCHAVEIDVSGAITLREDSIALVATDVVHVQEEAEEDWFFDPAPWMRSAFAASVIDLAERFVDIRDIQLSSGNRLVLEPVALQADAHRITVDFRPAEPARPF